MTQLKKPNAKKVNKKSTKSRANKNETLNKVDLSTWQTTDEDEIVRRQIRAKQEHFVIENLEPEYHHFSTFKISSVKDASYTVEIRSLDSRINSCNCIDFRSNGLATCKHIEFTLNYLQARGIRKFKTAAKAGSSRVEIFLDNCYDINSSVAIKIQYPTTSDTKQLEQLDQFFSTNGQLLGAPEKSYAVLKSVLEQLEEKFRCEVRVSQHIDYYIEYQQQQGLKAERYNTFMRDVACGKINLNLVKAELYPYQRDGMLHLAFNEHSR
jgi:hypothetical protein